MNWGFDVSGEDRTALIVSGVVPVMSPNEFALQPSDSAISDHHSIPIPVPVRVHFSFSLFPSPHRTTNQETRYRNNPNAALSSELQRLQLSLSTIPRRRRRRRRRRKTIKERERASTNDMRRARFSGRDDAARTELRSPDGEFDGESRRERRFRRERERF